MDKPRKIMWNTLFDFSFDFSMVIALLKRALTFFSVIIVVLSHCHACEPYAEAFDKLVSAMMASDSKSRVLMQR